MKMTPTVDIEAVGVDANDIIWALGEPLLGREFTVVERDDSPSS